MKISNIRSIVAGTALSLVLGCAQDGVDGQNGQNGQSGQDGQNGQSGQSGQEGQDGQDGQDSTALDPNTPLSSLVAVTLIEDAANTGAGNLADYVKELVVRKKAGTLPAGFQFPLAAAATDSLRTIKGLGANVVVKWLDPLTFGVGPVAPRFGANADFTAFFGDNWAAGSLGPQFAGDDMAGWMWTNHEYVSNTMPTATAAPTGQHLTLATFLRAAGILDNEPLSFSWLPSELDRYITQYKKQVGGSWSRMVQDPGTGEWAVDRNAAAVRYDATGATLLKITGFTTSSSDQSETNGLAMPTGVVTGMTSNCSGATTPWGTVLTGEENVQDFYGDLESCWDADQKFVAGQGFDPGTDIAPVTTPSTSSEFGRADDPKLLHRRDLYGFLSEIDPGKSPDEYYGKTTAGVGHRKLGVMGRARWENATFALGTDWKLVDGQPIVVYAGDDRRGGRIYKFVSSAPYAASMTKAQTRALLDSGKLYVAHFAGLDNNSGFKLVGGATPTRLAPGQGQWLELSVDNTTQVAPNAAVLGTATKKVGDALKDKSWNGLGGFPTTNAVKSALFTASAKLGVMELNRPEDIEYNPFHQRLYVAFTNHNKRTALKQDGTLQPAAESTAIRADAVGAIFSIVESAPTTPGASMTFEYFQVWLGSKTLAAANAANPDNIVLDRDGGVWFGTDGNFGTSKHADALYYLDIDATTAVGTPYRIVAVPSDAEATGPSFSSGMGSMFLSVQHPGEAVFSIWPTR